MILCGLTYCVPTKIEKLEKECIQVLSFTSTPVGIARPKSDLGICNSVL